MSKEIDRVSRHDSILILEIDHLLKKTKKERKILLEKNSKYESIMWGDLKDILIGFKEFYTIAKFNSAYTVFFVVILKKRDK